MKMKNQIKKFCIYELIGVILGDGSIWNYPDKRIYGLEISGNAEEELDYFRKISSFIENKIGKKPKIRVKYEKLGKTLKLVIYSKSFVEYLINILNIPYKQKTFRAKIEKKFLSWEFSKHIIRGLFETDGSLYFSKVNNRHTYPRIEIKTSSYELANQILLILKDNNFNPHQRTSKSDKTIGTYLSGPKELEKWANEVGFGSIKNLSKYLFFIEKGYYIPKSSTKQRLDLMRG